MHGVAPNQTWGAITIFVPKARIDNLNDCAFATGLIQYISRSNLYILCPHMLVVDFIRPMFYFVKIIIRTNVIIAVKKSYTYKIKINNM